MYVFIERGKVYHKALNKPEYINEGTKVLLLERTEYDYKVYYNSHTYSVQTHLIKSLNEYEKEIQNRRVSDSIAILNVKPYAFNWDGKIFYEPYNYEDCFEVKKEALVKMVKEIESKKGMFRYMILYNDSVFYTDMFMIESLKAQEEKLAKENQTKKRRQEAIAKKVV